jgi:hypothetical protein
LSRSFVTVTLAAVSLLVVLAAGGYLEIDAASPRIASASSVRAASQSQLDPRVLCRQRSCAWRQRSPDPAARVAAAPPARPPAPIAGRGYRVVFVDTFTRLRRRVWDNREWWNTPPPRRSQFVRRGVLHLVSRRSQGYENITVTTFSSRKVFKFGYFEARIKWTKGIGSWPAFWLMSNAWARRGADDCSLGIRAAEIDIFEGYGQYPRVFNGAIHRNSGDFICSPPADAFNSNSFQPQRIDLTRRFHTYAARWTPTRVTWYLDQRRMMSWPTYGTTDTRMFILLSTQVTDDPPTDSTTPNALRTKFDWVRVWQKR